MEEVKIWEEDVVIPTYEIGAAEKNPIFSEKKLKIRSMIKYGKRWIWKISI